MNTFQLISEPLPGLKVLKPKHFVDERGHFVKTYHKNMWDDLGLNFSLKEEFFSVSRRGVIRGMHFQTPPHAHNKVIFCTNGAVLDVVLDIRRNSETFGRYAVFLLTSVQGRPDDPQMIFDNYRSEAAVIYIPKGFAHGFLSLTDNACMVYKIDSVYAPDHDTGLLWDSFGFDWPIENPIISNRDHTFQRFKDYNTPF